MARRGETSGTDWPGLRHSRIETNQSPPSPSPHIHEASTAAADLGLLTGVLGLTPCDVVFNYVSGARPCGCPS